MVEITLGFAISVFVAGVLMFLAPCTLPLVPAYLAFISGVKNEDFKDPTKARSAKRSIITNGLSFIVGFSVIFIIFGILAGLVGGLVGPYRELLTKIGGIFIVIFGLMMIGVIRIDFLLRDHKLQMPSFLTPGKPTSAFIIGSTFAVGWTPCIGPVLASVLLLASTSSTAFQGGFLLAVFSLGLAVPFLATALLYAKASSTIARMESVTKWISVVGGLFLVLIGILLFTGNFGLTAEYGYRFFDFLHYEAILNYL